MDMRFDTAEFTQKIRDKTKQIQEATRPAAQAGAQVIYELARMKAPMSENAHIFYGKNSKKTGKKYLFYPGDLKKAIYQVYSKRRSGMNLATYEISWNPRKAPYGWMVELGTSRAGAQPFLTPAILEGGEEAQQAMKAEFIKRVGST